MPLFDILSSVDTPTVCNAIEMVEGRRGFNRFTRGTVICSDPAASPMFGYARTARIKAAAPSTNPVEQVRLMRRDYYRHMAAGPRPAIAVVEDLDDAGAVGAFWGEINTTVHKGFGLRGALTNGLVRDLGDLPKDFPVIAGGVGPSHAFVHVVEIGATVNVFGLSITDGEFVHADRHGAVVIPTDYLPEIETAIGRLLATEKIVLDAARSADFSLESFEKAWAEFERART